MLPRSLLPAILFCCTPLARAAEVGAGGAAPAAAGAPELGASALQMVFGLLAVLALLLGTLWLLKRLSQPRGPVAGLMRVIAGVAVGPRERVVILELGNSWLVLGVAPGQVSTLAEIPRQDIPASTSAVPADLPAWLRQVVKHRGKP